MENVMRTRLILAASSLIALGACATQPAPKIAPLETISHAVTPETANTLAARGLYAQAIVAYRAALKVNAEDAVSRHGLAQALWQSGKADEAKTEFMTLLANPEWKLRALEGLGRISFSAGDRAGAFDAFNKVVAEDATAWIAWLGIAQIH